MYSDTNLCHSYCRKFFSNYIFCYMRNVNIVNFLYIYNFNIRFIRCLSHLKYHEHISPYFFWFFYICSHIAGECLESYHRALHEYLLSVLQWHSRNCHRDSGFPFVWGVCLWMKQFSRHHNLSQALFE